MELSVVGAVSVVFGMFTALFGWPSRRGRFDVSKISVPRRSEWRRVLDSRPLERGKRVYIIQAAGTIPVVATDARGCTLLHTGCEVAIRCEEPKAR